MFNCLLIGYLSYRNGVRAKLKGQNPWIWGMITFFTTFMTFVFGMYFVVVALCRDTISLGQYTSVNYKGSMELANKIEQVLDDNPLRMVTFIMIGIGGYLIIRYVLEKMPGKKEPEVHWMDKLGQGGE